jgi:hypothetical protein
MRPYGLATHTRTRRSRVAVQSCVGHGAAKDREPHFSGPAIVFGLGSTDRIVVRVTISPRLRGTGVIISAGALCSEINCTDLAS